MNSTSKFLATAAVAALFITAVLLSSVSAAAPAGRSGAPAPLLLDPQDSPVQAADDPVEAGSSAFPPGYPTPVGIPFAQNNWANSDWRIEHPEYGPIGVQDWFGWQRCTLERIEEYLTTASSHTVVLQDGEVIPKPVSLCFNVVYTCDYPGWTWGWYDHTPEWVYDWVEAEGYGPRPMMGEGEMRRKVGHILDTDGDGPDPGVACPMYDNPIWQQAMEDSLMQIGAIYDSDPRLNSVSVSYTHLRAHET